MALWSQQVCARFTHEQMSRRAAQGTIPNLDAPGAVEPQQPTTQRPACEFLFAFQLHLKNYMYIC